MSRLLVSILLAGATAVASTSAHADDLAWSLSIGPHGQASVTIGNLPFVLGGPVYLPAPARVYRTEPAYWPQPVYAPPPVVVVPRVIHVPAPVYRSPRVVVLPPRHEHARPRHRADHGNRSWHQADRRHGQPQAGQGARHNRWN